MASNASRAPALPEAIARELARRRARRAEIVEWYSSESERDGQISSANSVISQRSVRVTSGFSSWIQRGRRGKWKCNVARQIVDRL